MEVEQAMFPPMVADLFPGQSLGRIMGVLSASSGLGASFGSWLGGYLYDLTVEDTFALLCALAATLAAVAFVWAAAPCKAQEMCTKG